MKDEQLSQVWAETTGVSNCLWDNTSGLDLLGLETTSGSIPVRADTSGLIPAGFETSRWSGTWIGPAWANTHGPAPACMFTDLQMVQLGAEDMLLQGADPFSCPGFQEPPAWDQEQPPYQPGSYAWVPPASSQTHSDEARLDLLGLETTSGSIPVWADTSGLIPAGFETSRWSGTWIGPAWANTHGSAPACMFTDLQTVQLGAEDMLLQGADPFSCPGFQEPPAWDQEQPPYQPGSYAWVPPASSQTHSDEARLDLLGLETTSGSIPVRADTSGLSPAGSETSRWSGTWISPAWANTHGSAPACTFTDLQMVQLGAEDMLLQGADPFSCPGFQEPPAWDQEQPPYQPGSYAWVPPASSQTHSDEARLDLLGLETTSGSIPVWADTSGLSPAGSETSRWSGTWISPAWANTHGSAPACTFTDLQMVQLGAEDMLLQGADPFSCPGFQEPPAWDQEQPPYQPGSDTWVPPASSQTHSDEASVWSPDILEQKGGCLADVEKKEPQKQPQKKPAYVKKPLNAFMLFMKERRPTVKATIRRRGSGAVNAFLGSVWKSLSKKEQSKYYQAAEEERLLHQQLHPGWSSRENYGKMLTKAEKRKLLEVTEDAEEESPSEESSESESEEPPSKRMMLTPKYRALFKEDRKSDEEDDCGHRVLRSRKRPSCRQ